MANGLRLDLTLMSVPGTVPAVDAGNPDDKYPEAPADSAGVLHNAVV
jgi:hypothetical protein